jgi:chromosome segregation ATPase
LAAEFELIVGIQKELKESFEIVQTNWQNGREYPCLNEINRWEEEALDRIRQVAAKARTTANEIMTKNMADIRRRLDQLAFDIEQRQEEGNYLDDDIAEVKKQLEQLDNNIKQVHGKIRINHTATNRVNWDSLICVTNEKKIAENRYSLAEFQYEPDDRQESLWTNFRRLIRNKQVNIEYRNKQTTFKRNAHSLFEPIVLTSYDSSTCSPSQRTSYLSTEPTVSENFQPRSLSKNDSSFVLLDYGRYLPQASDA